MAPKKQHAAPTTKKAQQDAAQQPLPRKHASGSALTAELCNLEVQLRKRKSDLEKALGSLELAKAEVKTAESEVSKVHDAIAEALYDLRSGQGRITFPDAAPAA